MTKHPVLVRLRKGQTTATATSASRLLSIKAREVATARVRMQGRSHDVTSVAIIISGRVVGCVTGVVRRAIRPGIVGPHSPNTSSNKTSRIRDNRDNHPSRTRVSGRGAISVVTRATLSGIALS